MDLLGTVKNGKCNLLKSLASLSASPIPLADILCTGNDILFKIMLRPDDFIFFRIFMLLIA